MKYMNTRKNKIWRLAAVCAAVLLCAACDSLLDDGEKTVAQTLAPSSETPKGIKLAYKETLREKDGSVMIVYTVSGTVTGTDNKFPRGTKTNENFNAGATDSPLDSNGKPDAAKNGGKFTIVSLPASTITRMLLSAGLWPGDAWFVTNQINTGVFKSNGTTGAIYVEDGTTPGTGGLRVGWLSGEALRLTDDNLRKKDAVMGFIMIDMNTDGEGNQVNGEDSELDDYIPPEPVLLKFYQLINCEASAGGTIDTAKYDRETLPIEEPELTDPATSGPWCNEANYRLLLTLKFENLVKIE
jgi:hypothetical protein